MIWIIVVSVLLVLAAVLYGRKRTSVLASRKRLEGEMQGVLDSFADLKTKIQASELQPSVKNTLVGNVDQNIETLERWKNRALPNVTFWKNHTEPIEKEFADLKESVARELSQYAVIPKPEF
jgi:hypothetical protein